jgi:hypothetical protein
MITEESGKGTEKDGEGVRANRGGKQWKIGKKR